MPGGNHALGCLLAAVNALRNSDPAIGVARQGQARQAGHQPVDAGDAGEMADMVLGHAGRPAGNIANQRFTSGSKQLAQFPEDQSSQAFVVEPRKLRLARPADKCTEQHLAGRRRPGNLTLPKLMARIERPS